MWPLLGGVVRGDVSAGSMMVGGGTGEVGVLGVADSAEDRLKPEFSSITLFSYEVGVVS